MLQVGPDVGKNDAGLVARDTANTPELIHNAWSVALDPNRASSLCPLMSCRRARCRNRDIFDGKIWKKQPALQANCVDRKPPPPPPAADHTAAMTACADLVIAGTEVACMGHYRKLSEGENAGHPRVAYKQVGSTGGPNFLFWTHPPPQPAQAPGGTRKRKHGFWTVGGACLRWLAAAKRVCVLKTAFRLDRLSGVLAR